MALSAAQMQEAVIKNLPEKTGKSLEEWVKTAKSFNLSKNSEVLKKLKQDYDLGHVQAQTIVWRMEGDKPYIETKGYEERIFKTTFKLYSEVKDLILDLSDEVKIKPCKTYIPFYRKNQFAIITEKKGELILGLNLNTDKFQELAQADNLGGSDRINKMIKVSKENLNTLENYIKEALKNN